MKRNAILILTLSGLLASPAFADAQPDTKGANKATHANVKAATDDSSMELLRRKLKSDKKLIVSENMDLSADEAKAFWPIYEAYQRDLEKLNQRAARLVVTYVDAYDRGPVSNELSKQLVGEALDIDKAEVDLKRTYVARFERVLPPYKLLRYVQMENKIRTVARYELAVDIPLAD
jgi:hypothetical protein